MAQHVAFKERGGEFCQAPRLLPCLRDRPPRFCGGLASRTRQCLAALGRECFLFLPGSPVQFLPKLLQHALSGKLLRFETLLYLALRSNDFCQYLAIHDGYLFPPGAFRP